MSIGTNKERIEQNNLDLENIKIEINSLPIYVDTSDATATTNDIIERKTAYVNSEKVVGTIPNNGEINIEPSIEDQVIPAGYTSGGIVAGDSNLVANNIRLGTTIFGVEGNLEADKPDQVKTVAPTTEEQLITPDTGYELASVTVEAVTNNIDSNIKAENIKKDVTILNITGTYGGKPTESPKLEFGYTTKIRLKDYIYPKTLEYKKVIKKSFELYKAVVSNQGSIPELTDEEAALKFTGYMINYKTPERNVSENTLLGFSNLVDIIVGSFVTYQSPSSTDNMLLAYFTDDTHNFYKEIVNINSTVNTDEYSTYGEGWYQQVNEQTGVSFLKSQITELTVCPNIEILKIVMTLGELRQAIIEQKTYPNQENVDVLNLDDLDDTPFEIISKTYNRIGRFIFNFSKMSSSYVGAEITLINSKNNSTTEHLDFKDESKMTHYNDAKGSYILTIKCINSSEGSIISKRYNDKTIEVTDKDITIELTDEEFTYKPQ